MGSADSTVDDGPEGGAAALPAAERDHYKVGDEISRGGIGRVLLGHDRRLDRTVAIKQLLAVSRHHEARFEREVRITARLQHPGIVPIYEAGRWPTGEPFYAMRLIPGKSLKEEMGQTASLDDRLAMIPKLVAVCDAVAYAHGERVIHRDLKPANVMVGPFGEVLVVDWGLAKELDAADDAGGDDAPVTDGVTRAGSVLGTPPYLAPEQARGEPLDERADVYALGVMLYELLTGERPYKDTASDILLARIASDPPEPITEAGAPRDLVALVAKAMARDKADRYRDAGELARDLRRFQTGQLVGAHRYSTATLALRWLRRHRAIVAVTVGALAVVGAIAAVSVSRVLDERDRARDAELSEAVAKDHAESEARAAEQRTSELMLMQADHWVDRDPTVAVAWLARHVATATPDLVRARELAVAARDRGVAVDLYRGAIVTVLADNGAMAGFDASFHPVVWRSAADAPQALGTGRVVTPMSITADGALVAWVDEDGLHVHDVVAGTARVLADRKGLRPPFDLALAKDRVLLGEIGGDISVYALAGGAPATLAGHASPVEDMAISPDGTRAATTANGELRLWTLATGKGVVLPAEERVFAMAFSKDGARLAWACAKGPVRWAEVATGKVHELARQQPGGAAAVAFSPDGKLLASGGEGGWVRVDGLDDGSMTPFKGHTDYVNGAAFSPDGKTLVTGQQRGGPVIAWDLATGDRTRLYGHDATLNLMRFTADGTLITADRAATMRRWRVQPARERVITKEAGDTAEIVPRAGGGFVSLFKSQPAVWDDADHAPRVLAVPAPLLTRMVGTADGSLVAAGDRAGSAWVWKTATGERRQVDKGGATDVSLSADGTLLVVGAQDGSIRVWTLADDHVAPQTLRGSVGAVNLVELAPDGKHVASASEDSKVRWWDLETGTGRVLSEEASPVVTMAFAENGTLAIARQSGVVELHRADGKIKRFPGNVQPTQLAWGPGAASIAVASNDGVIRLWDVATGKAKVLPHAGRVQALLAVGGMMVSGISTDDTGEATMRVWRMEDGALLAEWHGHFGNVASMAATADGKAVLSLGSDGTLRRWPLETVPAVMEPTVETLRGLTSATLGAGDVVSTAR